MHVFVESEEEEEENVIEDVIDLAESTDSDEDMGI